MIRTTNKRSWKEEHLIDACITSKTKADVIKKLGLANRPGNYVTIDKYIKLLNIDISHFTGKAHGTSIPKTRKDLSSVLIENSTYNRYHLKNRLIKGNLIPYTCSICLQDSSWCGQDLVLILDHINGIFNDNRISNLRFLCPNCNSQQSTFCRRMPSKLI